MIKSHKKFDTNSFQKIDNFQNINIIYERRNEKNAVNLKFKYSSVFFLCVINKNYSANFKAIIANNKFILTIDIIKYKNNFSSYFLENLSIFKDFKINLLELLSSGNRYSNKAYLDIKISLNFPKNKKYFNLLKYELNKSFYKFCKQRYNVCKMMNNLYNKIKQIIFEIGKEKIFIFPNFKKRELIEEQNKNSVIKDEDFSVLIIEYENKVEFEHIKDIGFYEDFIEFCYENEI